ncbi:hypothetical protein [Alistipes finegoldii]|uniref:hypothetical protein n=1 Tax=Alistipes finegoldii TaxID=214856 RepID=UPI001D06E2B2|nr:hypothetical protein [Alistipes finegoldii]MCB6684164.1 hypothetical protein [Alistipes finegoldii]
MKNQVTSIKQSKRLIVMGVPAERASMVWEMDEDCARLKIWNTDKETRRVLHNKYPNYYVPAFTVADLLAVLPKTIWGDQKGWIHLIIRFPNEDHCKIVYDNSYNILWKCDGSLLSCIVETIGWVITNGYRLNP